MRAWTQCCAVIVGGVLAGGALTARADNATWTGAANAVWNNNANWGGIAYPGTYSNDVATFTGTPTSTQPTWNIDGSAVNTGLGKLVFETAGWTISGTPYNELILRYGSDRAIMSQGSGTNVVHATVWQYTSGPWTVGAGNTLVMDGAFEQRGVVGKAGPGKLVMMGTGSGVYQNNGGGFVVTNGTVLCNYTTKSTEGNNSWNVSNGATLGGTGVVNVCTDSNEVRNLAVLLTVKDSGSTLAPGGDGLFGNTIGTLTVNFGATNVNANYIRMQDGARLAMDVSAQNGVSDRLAINLVGVTYGGYLKLSDTGTQTLAISGPATMPYGKSYTLVTFPTTAVNYGVFDAVTYNGANVMSDPNVILTYGTSTITLAFQALPPAATVFMVR